MKNNKMQDLACGKGIRDMEMMLISSNWDTKKNLEIFKRKCCSCIEGNWKSWLDTIQPRYGVREYVVSFLFLLNNSLFHPFAIHTKPQHPVITNCKGFTYIIYIWTNIIIFVVIITLFSTMMHICLLQESVNLGNLQGTFV